MILAVIPQPRPTPAGVRNVANRRRSRSSSGSPRTAKTEIPSSGCPSIDQARAVR